MQYTKQNLTGNWYYWLSSTPCLEIGFTKSTKITNGNDGCLGVPKCIVSSKKNYKTTLNTYVIAVCHPAHQVFKIKGVLMEAVTGYVYHCIPYHGQLFVRIPARQLLSSHVITPLLCADGLLKKYQHVYCDSFCFFQFSLVRSSYEKHPLTGLLCNNRQVSKEQKRANLP